MAPDYPFADLSRIGGGPDIRHTKATTSNIARNTKSVEKKNLVETVTPSKTWRQEELHQIVSLKKFL